MAMISGAFSLPGHNLSYFASSENIYDLVKNNLDKQHSQPRVLLLGFAERFITHHYKRGMFALDKTSSSTELKGWELFKYNLTFFDDPWDHDRFDFFFKRNIFVQPLFEAFQTYRYHLTGDLGSESVAPFVWKDTNMLFINGDWIFYREEHSNELIKQIAGSIAALADRLRSEFGIELTFIIFPNKFSIYGDKVYSKFIYDGFIPKITHELKSRGVATFDTYSAILPFRENPLLYVPTDTHLSLEGKELIVAKLKEEMKKRDLTPTAEQPLSRD